MSSEELSQITSQFQSLQSRWRDLYGKASLSDVVSSMAGTTTDVQRLPDDIAALRKRGYAFASYLEHKAEVLAQRWNDQRDSVQRTIDSESPRLHTEFRRYDYQFTEAENLIATPQALQPRLAELESRYNDVRSKIDSVEQMLKAGYAPVQTDVNQTKQQIQNIVWYLDQLDEASFKLLAGESLFLAAKAEWVATGHGKEDPDGILYLSDQRMIFEQKETTGKTLGLFGGKKAQELKWDVPLHLVESVEAENKGFLGGKDMLNFGLKTGAKYPRITVEVKGGVASKFWAAQVQRMISGNASDERAVQPDAETIAAIQKAPTACPSCGGTLPQLVANQRQVDCIYCGTSIRI